MCGSTLNICPNKKFIVATSENLLQYISIKNKYEGELRIFVLRRRIEFYKQRELNRLTRHATTHTSAYIIRLKQQQKTNAEA